MTTVSGLSFARAGMRVIIGSVVLATCLGAGAAMAGPHRHHGQAGQDDFNALVTPTPDVPGASIGSWRFRTFRGGGCDRSYPMHESYPCGSATGGPVGGMGS